MAVVNLIAERVHAYDFKAPKLRDIDEIIFRVRTILASEWLLQDEGGPHIMWWTTEPATNLRVGNIAVRHGVYQRIIHNVVTVGDARHAFGTKGLGDAYIGRTKVPDSHLLSTGDTIEFTGARP